MSILISTKQYLISHRKYLPIDSPMSLFTSFTLCLLQMKFSKCNNKIGKYIG